MTTNSVPIAQRAAWLTNPVVAEEKLDGANVSLWLEQGRVRVASRGGIDAVDRAGQLGRLRAWVAAHHEHLTELLADGRVAYAEWLWLTHTVAYDALADWLTVLDLYSPPAGLLGIDVRDRAVADAGLLVPPRLFEGVLGHPDRFADLIGRSTYGSALMEGIVLRRRGGERCKVVRAGFVRKPDAAWTGRLRSNQLRG